MPEEYSGEYFENPHSDRKKIEDAISNLRFWLNAAGARTEPDAQKAAMDKAEAALKKIEKLYPDFYEAAKAVKAGNDKLINALYEARETIEKQKEHIDKLCAPPSTYGTFLSVNDDGTINIIANGRKVKVNLHPAIKPEDLHPGQELVLNEGLNVVAPAGYENRGEAASVKDFLDEERVLIIFRADEERVGILAERIRGTIKIGDRVMFDASSGFILERLPKSEVEDLALEEVPDISYEDIGGLAKQIEDLRDAVELPFLHAELYKEHKLTPPKGILLHGPPGCGKTMIAKAMANNLAQRVSEQRGETVKGFFLNIKGPELLNKYVGETERKIREVFLKAKEKASEDAPVVIFFDEMDALFRTRGSGISSDVESTIVPQILVEIDGVEEMRNIIVVGASNRADLIDPGLLRPGRLDVKIRIERPDEAGAIDILRKYAKSGLPLHAKLKNFAKPYVTPNRLKGLLPEEWTALDKKLAAIRESLGLTRQDLGKRKAEVNKDGFRRMLEHLRKTAPARAEKAEATLSAQRADWEHESWELKSEEDCWNYFCYKTAERIFIKMPDKMVHEEMLMWISTEGEFVTLDTRFIEVTYANGDKEMLYHKDFISGAMLESIVRRAKKCAIKRAIALGQKGLRMVDFWHAVSDEFAENEDLPNTTNPDDWAKIAGRKGERIVYIKPMSGRLVGSPYGRKVERVIHTGQYV